VYQVAARAGMHICVVIWRRVAEMGSHAKGIGKLNLCHTPAMLLEEMSQTSGEGTQTELVNFISTDKPGRQDQLNVDIQKCKIVMTGSWPEGLIKNQMVI
jgi:hypothetical protein